MASRSTSTLVERFFKNEDPTQELRKPRHRIPLDVLRNFLSTTESEGRGYFTSPNDPDFVVAYNIGTEEIHRFPVWEAFAESDIYESYFDLSGNTDAKERYESWRLLKYVDGRISDMLKEALGLVSEFMDTSCNEMTIQRFEHNDLRRALFLSNSLWNRDRIQHLLKGTGLLPNAKKRLRDLRREMRLERSRDVWLANMCRILESKHYDVRRIDEIFDLDREDYHTNARERFMVIYRAGPNDEFLCTDTSFGVVEETELGADQSKIVNMTPHEHEQKVYTQDHAWHQIFVISPKLAIVLCHGSLMHPELTRAHRSRYGLRRSILEDLPHPVPSNYFKDLTKDEVGFISTRKERPLPTEVERAFGPAAWDQRVVAIDKRSEDQLRVPITTLNSKQVTLINSILLQNQQFGKVELVLFRWPDAHDSIVDALDVFDKLNGEQRTTEKQNDYRHLRRAILTADQNRSRPGTSQQQLPQYSAKRSPPPVLEPAPKGRQFQRRKSVHQPHPYDTPPLTPMNQVPPMPETPRFVDSRGDDHLRPRPRAQTQSNASRSAGEQTKVSDRPAGRRDTLTPPSAKLEPSRQMRAPPTPSHRDSPEEHERPTTSRRETGSSRDTVRPDHVRSDSKQQHILEAIEAADQRAYHAHQIADEKRRNAELEAARQQKFEARRLQIEAEDKAARERLRNAEALKEQEKIRQYEAAKKAAEEKKAEEQRKIEEARRRDEERRLEEAKKLEEARLREEQARLEEERRLREEQEEARKEQEALAESARLREIRLREKMEQRQQELRKQEAAEQEAAREATRQQEMRTKQAALEKIRRKEEEERARGVRRGDSYDSRAPEGLRSPGRRERHEYREYHRDPVLQIPPAGHLRLEPPSRDEDHTRMSDTSSKISKASSSKSDTRVPSSKTSNSDHDEPKTPVVGRSFGLQQESLKALNISDAFADRDIAESMIAQYDDDEDADYSEGGQDSWEDEGYAEGTKHAIRLLQQPQISVPRPSHSRRDTSSSKKSTSTAKPSKKATTTARPRVAQATRYHY